MRIEGLPDIFRWRSKAGNRRLREVRSISLNSRSEICPFLSLSALRRVMTVAYTLHLYASLKLKNSITIISVENFCD